MFVIITILEPIQFMDFASHLSKNNIKPSIQRLKIFEYLHINKNHPTADMIYSYLSQEIPTLSKTTVYNTLNLFVEKDVAITVAIEDNELRYDATIKDHAHFKCSKCEVIYDIEMDLSQAKFMKLNDFIIDKTSVYLNGKCKNCLNQ